MSFSAACKALDIPSFASGLKPVLFTPFHSEEFFSSLFNPSV
jgi:hypothetical protein